MVLKLRNYYPEVAKDLLSPLLKFWTVTHETFAGDFEQFFILAMIAARSAEDPRFAKADISVLERETEVCIPTLGINVRSISESTGIPLETVRRKVQILCRKGWVSRNGNTLSYTPSAFAAMTPVREAMLATAMSYYRIVASLRARERGEAPNPPEP